MDSRILIGAGLVGAFLILPIWQYLSGDKIQSGYSVIKDQLITGQDFKGISVAEAHLNAKVRYSCGVDPCSW